MRLILLAWRNLARNKRRTFITALAIALGAIAIVVLQGLCTAFIENLIGTKVESKLGAVQVFRKGYIEADEPLRFGLPADPRLAARIARVPGVAAVAPRMDFDGLVSNGSEATMFQATAIDPELEYQVCPRRQDKVSPGSLPLRAGQPGDMLIGKTLAESLGADKGATLVLQAAGPHASTNALDIEVSGFLPTADFTESRRVATVRLQFAQELLRMPGLVTSYVVAVRDLRQAPRIAARLRAELGSDYEVTTWADLDPTTRSRALSFEYAFSLVALVLFLLVATGIVNTMLMSVYERVREVGTMLSLGVRRRQVTALFLWEAGVMGFLSAGVGTGLGYAIVYMLGRRGITGHMAGGDTIIIYPRVGLGFLCAVLAFAIFGTLLSGLYPAWRAARLRPVEALRAN
jgi:putative ABC transport system permease protein